MSVLDLTPGQILLGFFFVLTFLALAEVVAQKLWDDNEIE